MFGLSCASASVFNELDRILIETSAGPAVPLIDGIGRTIARRTTGSAERSHTFGGMRRVFWLSNVFLEKELYIDMRSKYSIFLPVNINMKAIHLVS